MIYTIEITKFTMQNCIFQPTNYLPEKQDAPSKSQLI